MTDQTADDVPLVAKSSGSQAQVLLQVIQVGAAHVPQLHVVEVRPDAFVWVEVRRVARQLLKAESLGRTLGQKGLDRSAAMNRTVPDHQQLAWNVSQQMLKEVDYLRTAERVILHA